MESYLKVTDAHLLKAIEKDLNEDPERLARQIELFKEWLRCEPHLPKDIDDHLIFNFVRFCKCNLDKAKRKFENYLAARIKWRKSYSDRVFDEKYFAVCNVHRQFVIHPKLTPDGYRVCFYRIPPIEEFDFDQILHYGIALVDVMNLESTFSGFIVVYLLDGFSSQHLGKMHVKQLLSWIDFFYNSSSNRIKNIQVYNLPKIADVLLNLALKALNDKLRQRVIVHRDIENMSKYLPIDIVPDEFGGQGGNIEEYGELLKKYLIGNEEFVNKIEALKLAGPIPFNKAQIYSFDEYEMEGCFRTLNID